MSAEWLLDALWNDLLLDALASDGPISDADVKNAVKRMRPAIEVGVIRSARFRSALDEVFTAPGSPDFGPARGYYGGYLDSFIDALAAAFVHD
jgi:hypothetical protein